MSVIINRDNVVLPRAAETQTTFTAPGGTVVAIPRHRTIFNPENEEPYGVVKNNYKVVDYAEVIESFEAGLEKTLRGTGQDHVVNREIDLANNKGQAEGARMYALYRLPNLTFKIGDDVCSPTITITGSYDGTKKHQSEYGIWRYICSNGMKIGDMIYGYSKPHTKGLDAIAEIRGLLDRFHLIIEQKSIFERLTGHKIDNATALELAMARLREEGKKFEFPPTYDEQVVLNFEKEAARTSSPSAWHLYNAFNSILCHELDRGKGKVERARNLDLNLFKTFKRVYGGAKAAA